MDPIVLDKTLTNMVAFLLSWRLLTPVHVSKSMCLIQALCSNSYFQLLILGEPQICHKVPLITLTTCGKADLTTLPCSKVMDWWWWGGVVMGYSIDVLNCSAGFIKLSLT